MSCQTGPQNSKVYNGEEDSKKVVKIDFNKVGRLDLAVLCSICHKEVHISQLFHHKKTHQAQAVLDYQRPWVEPIAMNEIALQRKQLILRTSMSKYPEREREKIGCAVDLLKESLKIEPYFSIKSVAQSSVHIKEVSNPLIKAVAICQDKNAIWNLDLEDVFVVLDNYGKRQGTCFLGVFDGSNGISAAQTTSAELPLLLLDQLSHGDLSYQMSKAEKELMDSFHTVFRADYKAREKFFTYKRVLGKKLQRSKYEWIHRAYAKSFWRMDRLLRLGRNEVSRVCWSSCSAAICLVETLRNEKQDQEGEKTPERIANGKNQSDVLQEGRELPERIRAKKKSSIEHKAGSIPEEQREDPFERINDEKEQTIIQQRGEHLESINDKKEQNIMEQREDPLESINDEKEGNVIQQRGEPLETIKDEKGWNGIPQREEALGTINDEQHIIQQREESLETINDEKEQNIQQRGEPLETINYEKGWNGIQQREEVLETIDDVEQYILQQRKESLETINDEEQNIIQLRGEPLENINDEKEQNSLQQREPLETIGDGKEQNVTSQEEKELPERISGAKDQSVAGPETRSIMEQQLEEPFERINDGKEKNIDDNVPGDNEQMANNKDGINKENLLENNHSSDEVSVGLMHIANIGNVHAVLCKNGKSYWLTKEHSTYCREEKIRVLRNGGRISSNEPKGLIEGLIKNTRGLGHHGNPKLKKTVIPVPHTISFPVDDSCQFLILASNGLWEVLDTSEVVLLTLTMFSAYLEKYQVVQLKKNLMSKSSKLGKLEDEFYSWYLNQDVFPETDLNQNLNQTNSQLRSATNSANEKEIVKSDSFRENSEQISETSLELAFSQDASSLEDSEIHPPRSGTKESPNESLDESAEEPVLESPDSSETLEDTKTFYALAAKYISKHLVKAALKAGSRDNITVLVALLNGCDKIPTYV